jgi:carboxylesterase type B
MVHKAIIQSGGFHAGTAEQATAFTLQLLDFLGIDKDNIERLYDYTAAELIQAQRDINKTRTVGTYFDCPLVMDGRVIKYDPFDERKLRVCQEHSSDYGYDKVDAILSRFSILKYLTEYGGAARRIMSLVMTQLRPTK